MFAKLTTGLRLAVTAMTVAAVVTVAGVRSGWAAQPTTGGALPTLAGPNGFLLIDANNVLAFTVSDDLTPPEALTVTASSSNKTLLPDSGLVFGGNGAARTLTITPAPGVAGQSTITVTVSDGTQSTSYDVPFVVAPTFRYYLAEGATGPFFDTDIVIGNPHVPLLALKLTFFKHDGSTIVVNHGSVGLLSRTTVKVDEIAGMEDTTFSTLVELAGGIAPLFVERTMRWGETGYGSHTEKATNGAERQWLFAEGAQGSFFSTYFLLVNPQNTANSARVTYLREGAAPLVRTYPLLPSSRRTIVIGEEPALANSAFGARVEFDLPGMAERAMYFGNDPIYKGGHASAGVTAASTEWFLAEGATGTFFTTFVLLANPGQQPAEATITYLLAVGTPVVKKMTIPAGGRVTRNIADEDARLADAAVAVSIAADRPIIVERSQFWPNPAPSWLESHNSFGVTAASQSWGLAEGRVGGANAQQTYILLANPGTVDAEADISFLTTEGSVNPLKKTFAVPAKSRRNVAIAGPDSDVPELENEEFGAMIAATAPIVVERSLYANVGADTWGSGTNATGASSAIRDPGPADAGFDHVNVPLGTTVTVGSLATLGTDGEGYPFTFHWTLRSRPAGSGAALSSATAPNPTLVVDKEGDYVAELIIRTRYTTSPPDTVLITTTRPPIDVSVTASDPNASERDLDPATLIFTRTGDLSAPRTVPIDTINGDVVHGLDIDPLPQRITFPANQATVTLIVRPRADASPDGNERLIVSIPPGRDYVVVGGPVTIIVTDDPPLLTITSTDDTAAEGNGNPATVTFTRTGGDLSQPLSIDYSTEGTATNTIDYTGLGNSVVIPANQTSVTLTLAALADVPQEGNETVIVGLHQSANYVISGSPTLVLTIIDLA